MDADVMLTSTKWEIVKALAHKPSSPLLIAQALGTSIANVSAQLRLLEAAGLVSKRKVANTDAGKPRSMYSLSRDLGHVTIAAQGFARKLTIDLQPLHKMVFATMQLADKHQAPVMRIALEHPDLLVQDVFVECAEDSYTLNALDEGKPQQGRFMYQGRQIRYNIHHDREFHPLQRHTQICYGESP